MQLISINLVFWKYRVKPRLWISTTISLLPNNLIDKIFVSASNFIFKLISSNNVKLRNNVQSFALEPLRLRVRCCPVARIVQSSVNSTQAGDWVCTSAIRGSYNNLSGGLINCFSIYHGVWQIAFIRGSHKLGIQVPCAYPTHPFPQNHRFSATPSDCKL